MSKIAVVIAKDRASSAAQETLHEELLAGLERRAEFDVTVIPHLYDLAPDGPGIRFLRSVPGDLIVLSWLYPRSAYWVLDASGIRGRLGRTTSLHAGDAAGSLPRPRDGRPVPDRTVWCLDLRDHGRADPYLAEIGRIVERSLAKPSAARVENPKTLDEATRPRWYPVIDLDRCTNCLECLNFCLFGVFGLDEAESVVIDEPDACRQGCPACSRICPQEAIMFPQHSDPAIAGDPSLPPGGPKLDLSQLFAGKDPLKGVPRGKDPADMTAADRPAADRSAAKERALAEQRRAIEEAKEEGRPPGEEAIEHLVDDVEDLEL